MRKRKAFSLTEILVSVGILCVLVALIIPAVGVMLDFARAAKCSANLRTLAQAGRLYATDHDGAFTSYVFINGSDDPDGQPGLRDYVGQTKRTTGIDTVFTCPIMQKAYRTEGYALNHNYAINSYASADYSRKGKDLAMKRLTATSKPAAMLYFIDSIPYSQDYRGWYFLVNVAETNVPQFIYPHRNTLQAVFVDGHLEKLTAAEFAKRSADPVFWKGGYQ